MTVYQRVVLQALSEIADRRFQERVWLSAEGPEIGSLIEAVNRLFDDSGLGDVLGKGTVFSAEVDELLTELDRLVVPLTEEHQNPAALLKDSRLARIRELAASALFAIVRLEQ
jgi:hypothetical protein